VRIEHRIVRADGQSAWVDAQVTVMHDDLGRPSYALGQINEITDRRAHDDALRRHAEHLAAIAQVARAVGHSDPLDARQTVCRTAIAVGEGAATASIWEPQPDGSLQTPATLPATPIPRRVDVAFVDHGARVVMTTGQPLFVVDAATSPHCDHQIIAAIGAASVLFVPIADTTTVRGALAVGWPDRLPAVSEEQRLLMGVLAEGAAVAMQRADLLGRLDELTRTDELTGLPNRRAWDELLARELHAAPRHGEPLSIAMLDLDHFKRYNDRNGHLAGDRLLRQAASVWRTSLRADDVLARWGGEEFALLLPRCAAHDAAALIQRLRGRLPDRVTFSAGVTTTDGKTAAGTLLNAADQALYHAKANGRDQVVIR
jgi:diguanylate cyclase (GGDEF)-like protein